MLYVRPVCFAVVRKEITHAISRLFLGSRDYFSVFIEVQIFVRNNCVHLISHLEKNPKACFWSITFQDYKAPIFKFKAYNAIHFVWRGRGGHLTRTLVLIILFFYGRHFLVHSFFLISSEAEAVLDAVLPPAPALLPGRAELHPDPVAHRRGGGRGLEIKRQSSLLVSRKKMR